MARGRAGPESCVPMRATAERSLGLSGLGFLIRGDSDGTCPVSDPNVITGVCSCAGGGLGARRQNCPPTPKLTWSSPHPVTPSTPAPPSTAAPSPHRASPARTLETAKRTTSLWYVLCGPQECPPQASLGPPPFPMTCDYFAAAVLLELKCQARSLPSRRPWV